MSISASILYDYIQCPHRVSMDALEDPLKRDPESAFVKLLWEKGSAFERQVIDALEKRFVDLSITPNEERVQATLDAMQRREPLIYAGRIEADDLVGMPDLLRLEGDKYIPGDIKSGAGEEGASEDSDGKPKRHYAVQLALYVDILERLKLSAGRYGFIWDIHGKEVAYDLEAPQGPKTPLSLWDFYRHALLATRELLNKTTESRAAYGSVCKLCHWFTICTTDLHAKNDLTLLPELGRSRRESLNSQFASISEFAAASPDNYIKAKKTNFSGIGPDFLKKLHRRALLVTQNGRPYLREVIELPIAEVELFFDVETDPMRDICYLHGFVERRRKTGEERYVAFLAETPTSEAEEKAFREAWSYIQSLPNAALYFYSAYEKTTFKKLQSRYPSVCSAENVEDLFSRSTSVDLYYGIVLKATEWPTRDYSLKTLAKYLGFNWRDKHPSGAASIEWYHRWVTDNDPAMRQRILDYNEDDCLATRVLLDGIRLL